MTHRPVCIGADIGHGASKGYVITGDTHQSIRFPSDVLGSKLPWG